MMSLYIAWLVTDVTDTLSGAECLILFLPSATASSKVVSYIYNLKIHP